MRYTVKELAELSGVTSRTLRYYDQIGLLKPAEVSAAGYRLYGPREVDRLQAILLYREMALPLKEIARILDAPDYDREQALAGHLRRLEQQRQRLERLIAAVQLSIRAEKGEIAMQDEAKFAGLKERLLAENEERYGQELRERYDEETLAASRQRFQGLSEADYQAMEALGEEIRQQLAWACLLYTSQALPPIFAGHEAAAGHCQRAPKRSGAFDPG